MIAAARETIVAVSSINSTPLYRAENPAGPIAEAIQMGITAAAGTVVVMPPFNGAAAQGA